MTGTPPPSSTPVSIIVRTEGRRPELLRAALASLTAQSHRPLEGIVVEDGGARLAALVAAAGPGLRHLPIPKGGRSRAGNAGLAAATAPYVGFLDDDDELLPCHAALLAHRLDAAAGAPAAYAPAREVMARADGRPVRRPRGRAGVGAVPFSLARLWLGNFLPMQAVLARRSALEAVGGFDESLDALEDWDLWLRLAEAGDFVPVDTVTSWFRVPAEARRRRARAAAHGEAMARVLAKHADRRALFDFSSIAALRDVIVSERDDWFGARWCLGRLWRRLRDGR